LLEQIDEKLLNRAIRLCPRKKEGGFLKYGAFVLGQFRGGLLLVGGIVIAFVVLREIGASPYAQGVSAPLLGLLFSVAILVLSQRVARTLHVKQMLRSPIYSGRMDFSLSPEGLAIKAKNVQWNVSWPAIEKVINDRDGIFFYAGVFTYVLPKRVLGGTAVKDILASVEGWRQQEGSM